MSKLIYIGPSLDSATALKLIPDAIIRPPAKQGDILSDYYIYNPTHIFLIDGEFHQNLSPWHKELVFCLHEKVNVYGAASMGALRAADLWRVGMQGFGRIYEWYRTGHITDDSEVAVAYSEDYGHQTIPMVNVRATLGDDQDAIRRAGEIHYSQRTHKALKSAIRWPGWAVPQKRIDAFGLLENYTEFTPVYQKAINSKHLSHLFHAQNERDRQVIVNGHRIALQHIDAHAVLSSNNVSEELWNSNNRALALIMSEMLNIEVTDYDIRQEAERTFNRLDVQRILERNNLTSKEGAELLAENARIRKLHKALDSTRMRRRGTKPYLDHLRTWGRYLGYAVGTPIDDKVELSIEDFKVPKLNYESTIENAISELGFSTLSELCTAIKIELNR